MNNPPAFPFEYTEPVQFGVKNKVVCEGMTLRDYFAAAAMQGLCSQCDESGAWSWNETDVPVVAYKIADAMLAEREKL